MKTFHVKFEISPHDRIYLHGHCLRRRRQIWCMGATRSPLIGSFLPELAISSRWAVLRLLRIFTLIHQTSIKRFLKVWDFSTYWLLRLYLIMKRWKHVPRNLQYFSPKWGGQRPLESFPKIPPFWQGKSFLRKKHDLSFLGCSRPDQWDQKWVREEIIGGFPGRAGFSHTRSSSSISDAHSAVPTVPVTTGSTILLGSSWT